MARFALFVALVVLINSLVAGAQQTYTYTGKDLTVTINPSVGTLQVSETGTSSSFTFGLSFIKELNQQQQVVNSVVSFAANQSVTASQPSPNKLQSLETTSMSMTAQLLISSGTSTTSGATMILTIWVFAETGTILYNNKTVEISPDDMYINWLISGWPVQNSANTMEMGVTLATPGGANTYTAPVLNMDGAYITFGNQVTGNSYPQGYTSVSPDVSLGSPIDITVGYGATKDSTYSALWSLGKSNTTSAAAALPNFLNVAFF